MAWLLQIILTLLCSGTVVDLIQVTKLQKSHTEKPVAAGGMLSCSLVLTGLSYSWTDNLSNREPLSLPGKKLHSLLLTRKEKKAGPAQRATGGMICLMVKVIVIH